MESICVSKDLKDYISAHNNHSGFIHSVFNEAFNIVDQNDEMITLLSESKDIAPMSAIISISKRELSSIHQDDVVEFTSNGILFGKTNKYLSLDQADVWIPIIPIEGKHLDCKNQMNRLNVLKEMIISEGSQIGIAPLINVISFGEKITLVENENYPSNAYCDFIQDRLVALLKTLSDKSYEEFIQIIPNFIGFGPGLTPSTDDFLVGIMISLLYEALATNHGHVEIDAINNQIYTLSKGRTTRVSEVMLKHTALGKVSDTYRNLIYSMFFMSDRNYKEVIQNVIKFGSSSGTDFLFGVYCMNSIRLNQLFKGGYKNGQI